MDPGLWVRGVLGVGLGRGGSGGWGATLNPTLTYQTLLFCRLPRNSILGFRIRTYKKVGFGRLR